MHKVQEVSLLLEAELDEDVEVYDLSKGIRYILSLLLFTFSINH
jgi:hypothetical protein